VKTKAYFFKVKKNWRNALYNKAFKTDLLIGLLLLSIVFVFTYFYFDYIEHLPNGTALDDFVLRKLPARDVSSLIVFFEVSTVILLFARFSTNPVMFITFLMSFILVYIVRDVTIGITQLRAPAGIIELKDPLAGMVYRYRFITRDLFYSGHVSFVFLIYLCSNNKVDKYYTLCAVFFIGILLLIQHAHYVIDVISAPFFSFVCFWIAKRILHFQHVSVVIMHNNSLR
jgi:hypothetical protein